MSGQYPKALGLCEDALRRFPKSQPLLMLAVNAACRSKSQATKARLFFNRLHPNNRDDIQRFCKSQGIELGPAAD
jgi:hypothetical protein